MISIAEAAKRLGLSHRRVQILCKTRRIPGALLIGGRLWRLPDNFAVMPPAGRR